VLAKVTEVDLHPDAVSSVEAGSSTVKRAWPQAGQRTAGPGMGVPPTLQALTAVASAWRVGGRAERTRPGQRRFAPVLPLSRDRRLTGSGRPPTLEMRPRPPVQTPVATSPGPPTRTTRSEESHVSSDQLAAPDNDRPRPLRRSLRDLRPCRGRARGPHGGPDGGADRPDRPPSPTGTSSSAASPSRSSTPRR
jgi:hypothetical protein